MFGVPLWAIISGGAVLALASLVAFSACKAAGQMPDHPQPASHRRGSRRNLQATSRTGAKAWAGANTGSFSLDDELAHRGPVPLDPATGRPPGWRPFPVPGVDDTVVIRGPWADPGDLPAPELLDDLPPVPEHLIRQAYDVHPRPAAELPPGHVQRPDEPGEESYCEPCEERCTPAQPCTCCWLGDLSEDDQAAELDEPSDIRTADLVEGPGPAELDEKAPELVLAEEAHATQLREQDADARAFMERKAAELAELRAQLTRA
jgi:hypothetical protein